MKRLFSGLVLLVFIALGGVGFAAPAVAAYLCPACYGFSRVAPQVYVQKGHDASATLVAIDTAKARVTEALGWGDETPTLLICVTQSCADRLGPGPRAMAYGSVFLYLNPQGANAETLAHELVHIRVSGLVGAKALFQGRVPAWWNEGLATLIEGVSPRREGFADVDLPADAKLWRSQAARDHAVMYPAAAAKVADWLDRNAGFAGAVTVLQSLRRGGELPG